MSASRTRWAAIGAAVAVAIGFALRGLAPKPRRVGLLAGAGAGLLADALWRLICPYTDPLHATSHSAAIVAAIAVGFLISYLWDRLRLRAWRRRRSS